MESLLNQIAHCVIVGHLDEKSAHPPEMRGEPGVRELVSRAIDETDDADAILKGGLLAGMEVVGQKFRDNGLRLDTIQERIDTLVEDRNPDAARMVRREHKSLLRLQGALKDSRKQILRLRRQPEGKKREEAIDRVQRRFNKRFKEADDE